MSYSTTGLSAGVAIIGGDYRLWVYRSTDAVGTVNGASYFSDGVTRGMQVGDIVFDIDTDAGPDVTMLYVSSVSGAAATTSSLAVGSTPSVSSLTTASLTVSASAVIGDAAADVVGFYGATAVSQRASSVQATSNIASSTDFGVTQLAVVQEIMTTLKGLGLWKGAA